MREVRNFQTIRISYHLGLRDLDLQGASFGNFSLGDLKKGQWQILNKPSI